MGKSFIKPPKEFIIQSQFYTQMADILEFGIDIFGAKVAFDFYANVLDRVQSLPEMPDMYPKCRFIESTKTKTYRNILIEKYAILYCITAHTIRIITIYHTSIDPETIQNLK